MTRRRWESTTRPLLAVGAAALIAGLAAPVAVSSAPPPAEFPEGNWEGYYGMDRASAYADGPGNEVAASFEALGNFEAAAVAGTLSGRWLIDAHTVVEADGLRTEADAVAVGVFNGPTSGVDLELTKLRATEPTMGMTIEFTAGELPGASGGTMQVTGGDCNSVWGDWTLDFTGFSFVGQFTGFRLGPDADDDSVTAARRASQEALTTRGRIVLGNIRDGLVDLGAIRDLLQSAEGTLAYGGRGSCGNEDTGSFRAATTELIDSMLFEMAGIVDELDVDVLIELVVAGFRSGSFSADPAAREFWLQVYNEAVDAALASGDRATLAKLSAASRLLGFDEQADTIDDLLEELGS